MKHKATVNDSWSLSPCPQSMQFLYSSLVYITHVYSSHLAVHDLVQVLGLSLKNSDDVKSTFFKQQWNVLYMWESNEKY